MTASPSTARRHKGPLRVAVVGPPATLVALCRAMSGAWEIGVAERADEEAVAALVRRSPFLDVVFVLVEEGEPSADLADVTVRVGAGSAGTPAGGSDLSLAEDAGPAAVDGLVSLIVERGGLPLPG